MDIANKLRTLLASGENETCEFKLSLATKDNAAKAICAMANTSGGSVRSTGTAMDGILPHISIFTATNERGKKRETVLDTLQNLFNKFFDISGPKL